MRVIKRQLVVSESFFLIDRKNTNSSAELFVHQNQIKNYTYVNVPYVKAPYTKSRIGWFEFTPGNTLRDRQSR